MAELKESIYSIEDGVRTCNGDVVELISYQCPDHRWRSYKLYKIELVGSTQKNAWAYVILMKDDKYPVIITEDLAQKIIDDPEEGGKLAYSIWMSRYR